MSLGSRPCCLSCKLLVTFQGKSVPQDNPFAPLGQAEAASLAVHPLMERNVTWSVEKADQCSVRSVCTLVATNKGTEANLTVQGTFFTPAAAWT